MTKLEVGQDVVLRGRVGAVDHEMVSIVSASQVLWVRAATLELAPAPVTVKCDKCGAEHPLTHLPTLRARADALGIAGYADIALGLFACICAALAARGVTAEQLVEGL